MFRGVDGGKVSFDMPADGRATLPVLPFERDAREGIVIFNTLEGVDDTVLAQLMAAAERDLKLRILAADFFDSGYDTLSSVGEVLSNVEGVTFQDCTLSGCRGRLAAALTKFDSLRSVILDGFESEEAAIWAEELAAIEKLETVCVGYPEEASDAPWNSWRPLLQSSSLRNLILSGGKENNVDGLFADMRGVTLAALKFTDCAMEDCKHLVDFIIEAPDLRRVEFSKTELTVVVLQKLLMYTSVAGKEVTFVFDGKDAVFKDPEGLGCVRREAERSGNRVKIEFSGKFNPLHNSTKPPFVRDIDVRHLNPLYDPHHQRQPSSLQNDWVHILGETWLGTTEPPDPNPCYGMWTPIPVSRQEGDNIRLLDKPIFEDYRGPQPGEGGSSLQVNWPVAFAADLLVRAQTDPFTNELCEEIRSYKTGSKAQVSSAKVSAVRALALRAGFGIAEVAGDGSCFFHAVALGLHLQASGSLPSGTAEEQTMGFPLRAQVLKFMQDNQSDFQHYFTATVDEADLKLHFMQSDYYEDGLTDAEIEAALQDPELRSAIQQLLPSTLAAHLEKMQDTKQHADEPEIAATAACCNVEIEIFDPSYPFTIVDDKLVSGLPIYCEGAPRRVTLLRENSNHYTLLLPPKSDNPEITSRSTTVMEC